MSEQSNPFDEFIDAIEFKSMFDSVAKEAMVAAIYYSVLVNSTVVSKLAAERLTVNYINNVMNKDNGAIGG